MRMLWSPSMREMVGGPEELGGGFVGVPWGT